MTLLDICLPKSYNHSKINVGQFFPVAWAYQYAHSKNCDIGNFSKNKVTFSLYL